VKLSAELIAAVRGVSRIDEIAGEHVQRLRRSGVQLVGLCPFHSEKTPSFYVHPGKQVFHCHGCGVGGDVFKFVQLLHNGSFRQSVNFLATRGGIHIDGFKPRPELIEKVKRLKAQRKAEIAFTQFFNTRVDEIYTRHRALARSATWAEKCLRAGEPDPYVQDIAWDALERYRSFEQRVEREGLCDPQHLRTEWIRTRSAA
jgi:DNA primase